MMSGIRRYDPLSCNTSLLNKTACWIPLPDMPIPRSRAAVVAVASGTQYHERRRLAHDAQ